MSPETLVGIAIGFGLAAACGFRVFVPLLVLGWAARLGWFVPAASWSWLGTTPALIAFSVATAIEIAAAHVPWLDHVLDVVAAPLAVLAGALSMAGALGDVPPLLKWSFALVAGGGTAGLFHGLNAFLRAGTMATTAGLGNPLFAALETVGAFLLAALALLLPVAGLALAFLAATTVWRMGRRLAER